MLVQRDVERHLIDRLIRGCREQNGSVLLINGPAGTGVTALLEEAGIRALDSDAVVLRASGSPAERKLPLELITQLWISANTTSPKHRHSPLPPSAPEYIAGQEPTVSYAAVARELWSWLSELATEQAVVIVVDDLQHADEPSMQCLSFLARRLRSSGVLLILGELTNLQTANSLLAADLLSQPHCHRIRLGSLTPQGVTELLELRGEADPARLSERLWNRSGGSPLLLKGLIDDHFSKHGAEPPSDTDSVSSENDFADAVLSCIYRCETQIVEAGRLLAIAGERASPELIEPLLRTDKDSAEQILLILTRVGLLSGTGFRDRVAESVVLNDIPADQRSILYLRVAEILRNTGATCDVIAPYLLAANSPLPEWTISVIREAATQALESGSPETAVYLLTLAHRETTHEQEAAELLAMLADAEWQTDPPTGMRRLTTLIDLAATGHLRRQELARIVGRLLWCGRYADAQKLLSCWNSCPRRLDEGNDLERHVLKVWVEYSYPVLLEKNPALFPDEEERITSAEMAASAGVQAADLTRSLLNDDGTDLAGKAERLLQHWTLRGSTLPPLTTALLMLTYADRTDLARQWCDSLLSQAKACRVTAWTAALSNVSAEIALYEEDYARARRDARTALTHLPSHGWGTTIGRPLATLVLAAIALGDYDEAADLLRRPVPEVMFQSRFGLYYWHARGHYYLATGRPHIAVNDFRACGELMTRWQLDRPQILAWRTDLALVYLQMSEHTEAEALLNEQLAMSKSEHRRVHGTALRLLASVHSATEHIPLLEDTVKLLHAASTQHELSATIRQLHGMHWPVSTVEIFEPTPVRALTDGVPTFQKSRPTAQIAEISAPASSIDSLSRAELRVAALAARGDTNHRIARRLFITVSTVEQHLTRAYRKLGIGRRGNLPYQLRHHNVDVHG